MDLFNGSATPAPGSAPTCQPADFEALLQQYGKRKHPLDYANRYQLLVMVVLSARDSDAHINQLAPSIFEAYPDMAALAKATPDAFGRLIAGVTNASTKAGWLVATAKNIGSDAAIPHDLAGLTKHSGIGRKSANVIIRESGDPAEGIVVDLHVVRTAPRIGIAFGENPEKIEKSLMAFFPRERWNEAGMALSFLGREICRPSAPKCGQCPVRGICAYTKGGRA